MVTLKTKKLFPFEIFLRVENFFYNFFNVNKNFFCKHYETVRPSFFLKITSCEFEKQWKRPFVSSDNFFNADFNTK
jgi:hypothetical protein